MFCKEIIRRLLNLGAPIEWDYQGFNKFDYQTARALLQGSSWSEREERMAARMLYKYRKTQLTEEETKLVESLQGQSSKIFLKLSSNLIIIDFYYDKEIIEKVKEIPGRRFDPIKKAWNIPLSEFENACKYLEGLTLDIDPKIYQALDGLNKERQELEINPLQSQSPLKLVSSKELPRSGYICLDKEGKALCISPQWKDGAYEGLVKLGRYSNSLIIIKDRACIIRAFDLITTEYSHYLCTEKVFQFYLSLKERKEAQEKKEKEIKAIAEGDQTISSLTIPSSIKGKPYPFQLKGIEFMLKAGSGIIADEMGLGKTIEAICYAECIQSQKTLVVCPASLKWNWKKEIEKWTDKRASFFGDGLDVPYQITNYEALRDRDTGKTYLDKRGKEKKVREEPLIKKIIKEQEWDLIIIDEAHKMKSINALQTRALMSLRNLFKHQILLTGTPLLNRPIELFPLLNFVSPQKFNNWFEFGIQFAKGHKGRWGWDFSGSSNIDELRDKVAPHMLRRKKEEVLPDLPEKTIQIIEIGLNGAEREYRKAEADLISWIKNIYGDEKAIRASRAEQLTRFNYLKQICSNAKIDTVLELIENANGNKLVIFSQYLEPLNFLKSKLGNKAVIYTGKESKEARNQAVETFQSSDNISVFLGSIKAGGLGITLTAASTVLTMDPPWTPADLEQAEARLHRIGQKNAVLACRLICKDTIEESILTLLEKKKGVIGQVLGEEVEKVEEGILDSLINQLMDRR